jgi:hypothetical protein
VNGYQERSLVVKHTHFYTRNQKRSKFRKIKKAMEEKKIDTGVRTTEMNEVKRLLKMVVVFMSNTTLPRKPSSTFEITHHLALNRKFSYRFSPISVKLA